MWPRDITGNDANRRPSSNTTSDGGHQDAASSEELQALWESGRENEAHINWKKNVF